MRKVRLNGALGKKYGRLHKLDVQTPAEAIHALCMNFPGFKQDLIESGDRGVGYRCVVDKEVSDVERLTYPMSRDFSITPVVMGAGKVGMIIAGIALLAIHFIPGLQPLALALDTIGLHGAMVAWMGAALLLGGISQLLTPTPQAGVNGTQNTNNTISGATNTTAQGAPVPFGYGRRIVGSAVISAGITVEQPAAVAYPYDLKLTGMIVPA